VKSAPACSILSTGWTAGFRARACRSRIPISATLELTSRCNLRCQHCYLGSQKDPHRKQEQERSTEAVKASLDEWAAAGCLYLLITGGDPMMRRDFSEIYRHARELGLVVTVYCDGILVTDSLVALFRELPPRKVEISIYGATAKVYERVTRIPGSHARAWVGIRKLNEAGIRVGLKTILMTLNQQELEEMAAQAESMGLPFRYDAAIFPCLTGGSNRPLDLRVSPEDVVASDMATLERREHWLRRIEETAALPVSDRLYGCCAGTTSFCADPAGDLAPCLMAAQYRRSPKGRSFLEMWKGDLAELHQKTRSVKKTSFTGSLRGACTHCPAFNYLETGNEEQESEYIRKTTELRYQAAMTWKQEKESIHE